MSLGRKDRALCNEKFFRTRLIVSDAMLEQNSTKDTKEGYKEIWHLMDLVHNIPMWIEYHEQWDEGAFCRFIDLYDEQFASKPCAYKMKGEWKNALRQK